MYVYIYIYMYMYIYERAPFESGFCNKGGGAAPARAPAKDIFHTCIYIYIYVYVYIYIHVN